jgi:hypothetical protein
MKKSVSKAIAATIFMGFITSSNANAIGSQQKPPQTTQSTITLIGSQQKPPTAL